MEARNDSSLMVEQWRSILKQARTRSHPPVSAHQLVSAQGRWLVQNQGIVSQGVVKRLPDTGPLQAQRSQSQSACEEETGGQQSCGSQQGGKVETGTCVVGNGNLKGPGQDAADQRLLWGQGDRGC